MKKISKICINCPAGCRLDISCSNSDVQVSGNKCKKGEEYGRNEIFSPRRTVTFAVPLENGGHRCGAVKSSAPVPLAKIPSLLAYLRSCRIPRSAKNGDVLIQDFDNTGISVIITSVG